MTGERPLLPLWFNLSRYVHRENIVLAVLCAAAIAVFLVTKMAAAAAHDLRVRDARVWYERGVARLAAGEAERAVEALGRARALDRTVREYHLALAHALTAAGQPEAARQTLLGIRVSAPEDPRVNRGLAELEASFGNPEDAVAYYQRALYGAWMPEQSDERRDLRRAFIRYLLDRGMHARAAAQILLLADEAAPASQQALEAGELLLEARDPARALGTFRGVLDEEPSNPRALAGAARAAFAAGDYGAARRYFTRAQKGDAAFERQRRLTSAVLASDPLARGIATGEQVRRIETAVAAFRETIAACRAAQPGPHAELLGALEARLDPRYWRGMAREGRPEDAVAELGPIAQAIPDACAGDDITITAWRLIAAAHGDARS